MNKEEIIKDTILQDSVNITKKMTESVNHLPNDNTELISNLIKFVDVLKWPLLILIIVLIFKKNLLELISKVKKIGHGGTAVEIEQQTVAIKLEKRPISNIDKALGLFREETISFFSDAVLQETDIETYKSDKEKTEHLLNYSIALYIIKHYDMIYNAIYGSQLQILQQLNSNNSNENMETIKRFYDFAAEDYPKFYNNYSFEEYINFLISFSLIIEEKGKVKITILGLDFLKYLTETSKNFDKAR
jgi:hypothetical protein